MEPEPAAGAASSSRFAHLAVVVLISLTSTDSPADTPANDRTQTHSQTVGVCRTWGSTRVELLAADAAWRDEHAQVSPPFGVRVGCSAGAAAWIGSKACFMTTSCWALYTSRSEAAAPRLTLNTSGFRPCARAHTTRRSTAQPPRQPRNPLAGHALVGQPRAPLVGHALEESGRQANERRTGISSGIAKTLNGPSAASWSANAIFRKGVRQRKGPPQRVSPPTRPHRGQVPCQCPS